MHAHNFTDSEDQPIQCYNIYLDYKKEIDKRIEVVLTTEGIDANDMFAAC